MAAKKSIRIFQIVKALGISEREGLARFESLQAYYTLAGRDLEREIVPMLKSETEEIQRRIGKAIADRDGDSSAFHFFDTICGATQERQDALFDMLKKPMDLLLVVGGYNSSNTAHLVEIAEPEVPTFFIRGASCIRSLEEIVHYDLHRKEEVSSSYAKWLDPERPVTVGITAGASCPNNLIEETIFKVFELRGVPHDELDRI